VLKRQQTLERKREPRGEPRPRTGERARTPQRAPPQLVRHNTSIRGVVNTIAGGFAGGGSLASARKNALEGCSSSKRGVNAHLTKDATDYVH